MSKSPFRVPHTLVLLFGMIVLALLSTYLIPQGQFERIANETGRMVVVPGTYETLATPENLNPLLLFTAIPRGFAASHEIIFFCFIIGGALAVLRATGAVDAALGRMLIHFQQRARLFVILSMLVFTIGSSTLGMAEEYLPFVPVLLALAASLRMDAVAAIGIMVVGYGIGYGVSAINPFTLVIAQEIAGLPPTSGIGYRLLLTLPFVAIGMHHVWSYANRVRNQPQTSLVADIPPDADWRISNEQHPNLTRIHVIILVITAATIGFLVWGIAVWHWYLTEMSAVFLAFTVLIAFIGGLGADAAAKNFCKGAAELTTTALLIGFARAIQIILEDGHVIDTIVHSIAEPLSQLGPHVASVGMYLFQSLCNLFIPSGSGQAYVTMPVMTPIADITHVSRQTAVLAFQFGDGFTNMIVPTNAVLVGILGLAKIPYDRWFRFILPLMVKLWIAGSIALVIAVAIAYQ